MTIAPQIKATPLLSIRGLSLAFQGRAGLTEVVSGIDLDINGGETLALVGESGSGKTIAALSILKLFGRNCLQTAGEINFNGHRLDMMTSSQMQQVRGAKIAMIFQDPMTSLNPTISVGRQIASTLEWHLGLSKENSKLKAIQLLEGVGIADPQHRFDAYPFQLSGGIRQRVMIAIALACDPQLLIADEPTTALDVTVQAEIIELLKSITRERGMSTLLITHDLGLVAGIADRVAVMQKGKIVESADVDTLFSSPQHPYTQKLLYQPLHANSPILEPDTGAILQGFNITKDYPSGGRILKALNGINLSVRKGETLGIAGESGSGKSTLGRLLLGLERTSGGSIYYKGKDLQKLTKEEAFGLRRQMQVVFQDPYASLNPRMTIEKIIGEGIDIHRIAEGKTRADKILYLLNQVGLDSSALSKFPHQFSGGQRQRIAIARALAVDPEFLVLDEPLSALDASTQHQIMELLLKLKRERQLTYLFISHDLNALQEISDRVAIMYLGNIVEYGITEEVFRRPLHPYTKALISAIPIADPVKERSRSKLLLRGEIPSPLNPPSGCPFHTRCPSALPMCKESRPSPQFHENGRSVACSAISESLCQGPVVLLP